MVRSLRRRAAVDMGADLVCLDYGGDGWCGVLSMWQDSSPFGDRLRSALVRAGAPDAQDHATGGHGPGWLVG